MLGSNFLESVLSDDVNSTELALAPQKYSSKTAVTVPRRMLDSYKESYERQDEEASFPWWAFQVYLSLGEVRSIAATCRRMLELDDNMGITHEALRPRITKFAKDMHWKSRAKDFDAHVMLYKATRSIHDIDQMNDRHAGVSVELQSVCLNELNKWKRTSEESFEPVMTVTQLTKTLDLAFKAERLARGEPSEIVKQSTNQETNATKEKFREMLANPKSIKALSELAELTGTDTDSVPN